MNEIKDSNEGKKRNRFSDFLIKCIVWFALLAMVLGILLVSLLHFTETSDRRVMYKLLNYSRETMIEGKAKYFKLPDVPEFKIYPINENEFTVVFTNGKTVSSKDIVIAGAGDNTLQTGFIEKQKAIK